MKIVLNSLLPCWVRRRRLSYKSWGVSHHPACKHVSRIIFYCVNKKSFRDVKAVLEKIMWCRHFIPLAFIWGNKQCKWDKIYFNFTSELWKMVNVSMTKITSLLIAWTCMNKHRWLVFQTVVDGIWKITMEATLNAPFASQLGLYHIFYRNDLYKLSYLQIT